MADPPADDSTGDDGRPPDDADIGAAVDDAMDAEIRRQKARFVQHIIGLDRIEGVGRRDERWDEGFLDRDADPPAP
jgi:hypothetical protein